MLYLYALSLHLKQYHFNNRTMFSFVRTIPLFVFLLTTSLFCFGQEHQCMSETHLENDASFNKEYQKKIAKILERKNNNRSSDDLGLITIPVVVHIIHNSDAQNISDAQVQSQIDVLNSAFNLEAPWITSIYPQAADVDIQFVLANVDPDGNATEGITRTSTSVGIFTIHPEEPLDFPENTHMKFDSEGGKDAWPTDSYLNIWVINCQYFIKGFGSLPGTIDSNLDGVVMNYKYFGNIETGTTYVNYAGGKSCVHEVGHWLDLRHIFANNDCAINDGLDDTPAQENFYFSCAAPITECGNNLMLENYMQYTYDQCQFVYTEDQKTVMRSNFLSGEYRESLLTSTGYQNNALSSIHGTFWHDGNADGIIDNNEARYSNVEIKLFNCNNQLIETNYTDNQGFYEFADIVSGDYYLLVNENSLPNGMGPDPIWFEFFGCALINNGNSYLQDFGLLSYASVGGSVWQELNFNGSFDSNESGLNNVNIHLYDEQFSLVSSTNTNSDGQYNFPDVYPGEYYLSMDPPNGLSIIPQPSMTHYFDQSNGPNTSPMFNFTPGYNMLDLNAALGLGTVALEELVINGTVFNDHNLLEWEINLNQNFQSIELQKKINSEWNTIYSQTHGNVTSYQDFAQKSIQYYRLNVIGINGSIFQSNVIAIENHNLEQLIYCQNPIEENLYIKFNNQDFTTFKVILFNTTKCLIQKSYASDELDSSGQLTIDMCQYPAGIYYLEYDLDGKRFVKKLIKTN